ncbi:MAG: MFS transporter [Candidatus Latescibacterota bacterium]|nr:MFS transporter [Candidatus Latescibacterota bacterium]
MKKNSTLFDLLSNKDFLFLWLANGFWWQAMWIEMIIVGWLTLEITNSAWSVSVAGFCRAIPLLIIGPIGPVIIQHYEKRKVLWVLQGGGTLSTMLLIVIHLKFGLNYPIVLIYSLTMGILWAMDWPTRRSIVPDIVGNHRVVDGLLLENILQSLTRVIGPIGGGYTLALVGITGSLLTLFLISMTSLLCLFCIGPILVGYESKSQFKEFGDEFVKGWIFVRNHASILGVFFVTLVMNVWAFPFQILLPVIARDVLNQGPVGLGLLVAANGIGGAMGLWVVNQIKENFSNEFLFVLGSFIVCAGLFLFSLTENMYYALLWLLIAGIGQAGFSVMQSSIILTSAPIAMRGRAMGAIVFAIGVGPLGRLQCGATAESFDSQMAIGSMAVFAAVGVIATGFFINGFIDSHRIDRK